MKKRIISFGVIITSIIIITTMVVSYGFLSTKVLNKNNKKESFLAGNMEINYSGGTEKLITAGTVFKPNSVLEKTFTVKNVGNTNFTYDIHLVKVKNTFKRTNDITYEIYKNNELIKTDVFPTTDLIIASNIEMKKNETQNFKIRIIYNNSTENQIIDSGSTISAQISFGEKSEGNKLFKDVLLENKAIIEDFDDSGNRITFLENQIIDELPLVLEDIAADAEVSGMFTKNDDDGTSYVYRGTIKNNYVNFAGFVWRIVRINGDGSIRLILDGTLDKVCNTDNPAVCTTSKFNDASDENIYVGYMYGLAVTDTHTQSCLKLDSSNNVTDIINQFSSETSCINNGGIWTSRAYPTTHANVKSSTVKNKLDAFYEAYLKDDYSGYLADTIFCSDKTIGEGGTGVGTTTTYYAAYERLYRNRTEATPSLLCNGDYSYYTVEENLKYPIGLLNADELVIAGAFRGTLNQKYYLYNADTVNSYWWLSTPFTFASSKANIFMASATSNSLYNTNVDSTRGVRPVINLDANILYESGDGTESDKYTIKLAN